MSVAETQISSGVAGRRDDQSEGAQRGGRGGVSL